MDLGELLGLAGGLGVVALGELFGEDLVDRLQRPVERHVLRGWR